MSTTAMLVIDMLNAYRHDDAEPLAKSVADIIDPLTGLIAQARNRDDVDLVYVNDNYGDFTAARPDIIRQALDGEHPELVEPIVPDDEWPFLEKVRHSAAAHIDPDLGAAAMQMMRRNMRASTPKAAVCLG